MTKNFFNLSACFHLEVGQDEGYDPRQKVNSFIESLCNKFQNYFYLGEKITIDESLVYFKGRRKNEVLSSEQTP